MRKLDMEKFNSLKEEDLPDFAYALRITSRIDGIAKGDCVIVKKGEGGYYPTDWPKGVYTQEAIDEINERLGVSREEAEKLFMLSFRLKK